MNSFKLNSMHFIPSFSLMNATKNYEVSYSKYYCFFHCVRYDAKTIVKVFVDYINLNRVDLNLDFFTFYLS